MAKYRVTGPDGATYEINAPDGASQDDVMSYVQAQSAGAASKPDARRFAQPSLTPVPGVGRLPAALEGAAQGLTFGFSDEIEGGARALYGKLTGDGEKSFGDLYTAGVAIPRERQKTAAASQPFAYHAGEIGAGFAVPGGLAKLGVQSALAGSAGRGLVARSIAGAKDGAAYGAAYGAGKSEGGIGERLAGAAEGGLAGAALGGVLPGTVDLASAVARRATAPLRAAYNPQAFAAEKLGEALTRDAGAQAQTAGGVAARTAQRFDAMAHGNRSVMLADTGGENVRGLMRSAGNMPNDARESMRKALDARQANQWNRIERAADSGLAPGKSFGQTIDDLVVAREAAAGPDFKKAFAIETPITERLIDVLNRPTMQRVGQKVVLRLEDEGKQLSPANNTEWMHRVKLELDDLIGQSKMAEKMGNTPQAGFDTKTLVTLKKDLLGAIVNPAYKTALNNYAGPSALKFAAEQGEAEFLKASAHEIRRTLAGMTKTEAEMYRMGAKQAMFTRMEAPNVNRDLTDGLFGSAGIQKRLAALFPDQRSLREFQRSLVTEAKMADTRKAMQGNSTTAKQLTEGSEAGKTAGLVASAAKAAASGRLEPVLNVIAQGYNRFSGITPRVAQELIRLGMSKDPSAALALSRGGIERASRAPQRRAAQSGGLIAGSASGAVPFGLLSAPLEISIYPPGDPRNNR